MSADKCERCGVYYRGEHTCEDIISLQKIADTLGIMSTTLKIISTTLELLEMTK